MAAFPAVDEIVEAAHPGLEAAAPRRRHQGRQPPVRRPPHRDDDGAVDLVLPARRDGAGGRLRRPLRAGRRARRPARSRPTTSRSFRARWVPYAYDQATSRSGAVVAVPTDIGPGTLLYRADVLAKAGVGEAELTRSWDSYVAAGVQDQGRHRRLPDGACARHEGHRDPHRHPARRGPVLRPGQSRVLVTSPRFVRAFELAREVRRNKLDARVARLVQRVGRRLQARHPGHADDRRLAGRPPEQLAGARHQGPVARGAAARRRLRGLRRHLLRHPARLAGRPTRRWPGSSSS